MGLSRDAWAAIGWDMDNKNPLHRAAFRAQGKATLLEEVADAAKAPAPVLPVLPDPEPDLPRALPEWAEELRGCDLPRCPVCALAHKGFL